MSKKSKKKKRKRHSSSSSSSEPVRKKRKKEKKEKKKKRKKERGEVSKSKSFFAPAPRKRKKDETKEERRARKKREKLEKEQKNQQISKNYYFGYTDNDNPYGDDNLTKPFVWAKKYEAQGLTRDEIIALQREKQQKTRARNYREINNIRERQVQRAREKEEKEAMEQLVTKALEQERNADWKDKETEYHRKTALERAKKRVVNHRPIPLDIITCVLHQVYLEQQIVVRRVRSPVEVLELLSETQLEELLEKLEETEEVMVGHEEQWGYVRCVAEHQLDILQGEQKIKKSLKNISEELENHLQSKNPEELEELEDECERKIAGESDAPVDIEYWEEVQRLCQIHKCKLKLKRYYTQYLDAIQEKTRKIRKELESKGLMVTESEDQLNKKKIKTMTIKYVEDDHIPFIVPGTSRYSELEPLAKSPADDRKELEEARSRVLQKSTNIVLSEMAVANPMKFEASTLSVVEQISQRADRMHVDGQEGQTIEVQMRNEIAIPVGQNKVYLWHQKYQPRKPEYFNRVKTGFSWSKYNQAHYNVDNPPPKVVIGYKFNIFYPDLIDKSKTPDFKVFDEENSLYATIIFRGGPPYEDIAFRIVNNPWEFNNFRGYRCRFENGIFSLYFNFKKRRYRR